MIIAQISDTHIALDSPDADKRIQDFKSTIADINTLNPPPDVIVHTGDIVHNGRTDEYAEAAAILSKARTPDYVMVGNKDDRSNLLKAFTGCGYLNANTNFIDYAIEVFPVRLVMLDTLNPASNKGDFCTERITRFNDLIDAETSKPIAVFTHHPPFEVSVGPDPIHFDPLEAMDELRKALQNSGRVIAVISGHVHRATSGSIGTIPASVMPCIATTLRRGDYPPEMKACPLYHLHRLDTDGSFSTETRIVRAQL
jgi:Icc protein